ncbi:MAG: aminopeptidase P family protein [Bryobacterales bacterium]|nr:aminopeptidase P family protein [Bryobacterales bacterium]
MLTAEGSKARRDRLSHAIEQNGWDLFLTTDPRTVYYFTAEMQPPDAPVAYLQFAGGRTEVLKPETYSIHRVVDYPEEELRSHVLDLAGNRRAGVEMRTCIVSLPASEDATRTILRLRKCKEEDEIDEIRSALELNIVAYDAAKAVIAPGAREIDVYNAMYQAVVRKAGTAVEFKGDFACGERCVKGGGPPTERVIEPGDLYVLDLFPAPAYYFSDTCRTFAAGPPTDLQQSAWDLVMQAMRQAKAVIRPGVKTRDVYLAAKQVLDSDPRFENTFWHHLGHGIGHRGHEAPRIIPGSDDIFEEGDVFTLEPGLYSSAIQGGIRIEDNYVVRANGVENLFHYPHGLV